MLRGGIDRGWKTGPARKEEQALVFYKAVGVNSVIIIVYFKIPKTQNFECF